MKYPITLTHEDWAKVLIALRNYSLTMRNESRGRDGASFYEFIGESERTSKIWEKIKKQRDPMKKARKK